ncbi:MAG TPA: hypothetical protein VJT50_05280 [Pyrinomonadaceae bacterium]|nr:hypothetical protein [Pyrinomonadaceae bacterium]
MNRLVRLAIALSFLFTASFAAQAQEDACRSNERNDVYTNYYNKKKGGDAAKQKEAYEIARQYLQKWPQCNDEYSAAARKFIDAYEVATAEFELRNKLFGTAPNYAEAMELGKKVLVAKPDDLNTLMMLGYGGYVALTKGDKSFIADATTYLRKALDQIQSGKTPAKWDPFQSKEDALGLLNFSLAEISAVNNDIAGALPLYFKALTIEGPTKKLAVVYGRLATVYEVSAKQASEDYTAKYAGKPETPESKAAYEKVNQTVDHLIDYYARAVSLIGDDKQLAPHKAAWLERLTTLYKYRHEDKTDGLEAYMASVMNSPLPQP